MPSLDARVQAALLRAGYASGGVKLVVAVSGGPDSMALMHLLTALKETAWLELHVAHLNHDFRGEEAFVDARFVAAAARDLGLRCTVEEDDPEAYRRESGVSSFEEAARELRYRFLARVAESQGAQAVAVGHTADDLAETVLMHVIRGSGLHGLRGMEEVSRWVSRSGDHQTTLFRPLLGTSKRETADYCLENSIAVRKDLGNDMPRFTRNRVRSQLMPALAQYNPRIIESLNRLSETSTLVIDYLESQVDALWERCVKEQGGWLVMDSSALAQEHPLAARLLLRRAYLELAGDPRRLYQSHLRDMANLIEAPPGKSLRLPRGLYLHSSYGRLWMGKGAEVPCPFPELHGETRIPIAQPGHAVAHTVSGWQCGMERTDATKEPSEGLFTADLDLDSLGGEAITIRTRKPGDRFHPLGMDHSKKLQDFFVDQKVPRAWRDRTPLVTTERGIAWVVGHRVAEWAKVCPDRSKLRLSFRVLGAVTGCP